MFYAVELHKYNTEYDDYKQKTKIILLRFLQKQAFFGVISAKLRVCKSLTYLYMNGILFIEINKRHRSVHNFFLTIRLK